MPEQLQITRPQRGLRHHCGNVSETVLAQYISAVSQTPPIRPWQLCFKSRIFEVYCHLQWELWKKKLWTNWKKTKILTKLELKNESMLSETLLIHVLSQWICIFENFFKKGRLWHRGSIWGEFMKRTKGRKSRTTIPFTLIWVAGCIYDSRNFEQL